MDRSSGKLTVYFEDPFWVGVFERYENESLAVCKVTFGAEPKDGEVFEFVLKNYTKLKFSPAVKMQIKKAAENPKRLQREARKQTQTKGIGTKSQQALKLLQEQNKLAGKVRSKERRLEEKQYKFALKQQKRKEKHKGR